MKNLTSITKFSLSIVISLNFLLFLQGCKLFNQVDHHAPPTKLDKISKRFDHYYQGHIQVPGSKEIVKTYVALTGKQREQGLSHVKPEQMSNQEALLFIADSDMLQYFWMPSTHFDLDIFYLSKDLIVLDIQRDVPHFPQEGPRNLIPKAKPVFARHVLEMKAGSPLAKKIVYGAKLIWKSESSLEQILLSIRQEK
ncbi:DUF192 domain-containing protein [Bacteriovoracaceae bacterium]|nr:DUF192 domain-containing protein [Bacteriovoracaceae bacterium]